MVTNAPHPLTPSPRKRGEGVRGWGAFTAILLTLSLAGCHRPLETHVEHSLTDLLPRYLGKADSYTARVEGRPDALYRGHLRRVHIEGVNVALLPDLTVEKLTVDVREVSVNRGTNALESVGETRFVTRVGEAALNRYVTRRRPDIHALRLSLGADGKATVTATPALWGVPAVPVSLRGTVAVAEDGSHLLFAPDRASVNVAGVGVGTGLPGFVAEHIASRLNPVADFGAMRLPLRAESVRIERGAATIAGIVPPGVLQKAVAEAQAAPR